MTQNPARSAPGTATVRRVRPADAARVRALRLEMLADAPLAFLETLADAAARPHAEYAARIAYTSRGSHTAQFVAEPQDHPGDHAGDHPAGGRGDRRGHRLVGHAGGVAAADEPDVTVVFAVYVTPTWRGTGLLADLVDGVGAWSRACGRPQLMLEVVVGNDRAYRAYRRLGFTDTGIRVPHPTIPALWELQMRRAA
ncbi:GNAT family N-acetyltransferase [Micromonospora cathayae]|uniref:GNAT family N-acetyltransferase n=1 Tax=Micromonospora cathayae TaxID=3028804 RepID=A0ABY7ZRJ0_9ACTN|nr:GNAT family N-acetyltransferase [Micromonospora sp. HUAS 3]WDZ85592.1 GNAT family N-acetyltransferase [Micromonospora sp. HUAS 3]